MLIIGTRFFSWGSDRTPNSMHCGKCGAMVPFIIKKGMRFITLFFIIPVVPISGVKHIVQCPNCGTRFQAN
jgi:ribosomal protein S27AE